MNNKEKWILGSGSIFVVTSTCVYLYALANSIESGTNMANLCWIPIVAFVIVMLLWISLKTK